jgi:hypothetical protein
MLDSSTHIELGPVRIGADFLAEMDGDRPLLRIPRDQVAALEARYGSAAERPLVSIVLGAILMGVAILGPLIIVLAVVRGTEIKINVAIAATIALVIPAVWLFDLALRNRWCLLVYTKSGKRKLAFARSQDAVTVEQFLATARSRFGYAAPGV